MGHLNVWHIDDDDDDIEIFRIAIEYLPTQIKCTSYTNALEAYNNLNTGTVAPDIIFLDINMPIMNGFEFLEKMGTDIKQQIPIIVLSTCSLIDSKLKANNLGAKGYMVKPTSIKEYSKQLAPYFE